MTRVLIAYGTSEGQTARIAEYLTGAIRDQGHEAFPVDIKRSGPPEPNGYDAVGLASREGRPLRRCSALHQVRIQALDHEEDRQQQGSPDTDTSRDYFYTDWADVKRFAEELLETSFPKACAATGG
jgi:menaquinone-dependent protoporphyrinogen IX oxidase